MEQNGERRDVVEAAAALADAVALAAVAPGSEGRIAALAARLRVPTAVAEAAVDALSGEGLIARDGETYRVRPIDSDAMLASADRRLALEIAIARGAAARAGDAERAAMREAEAMVARCAFIGDMDGMVRFEMRLEALLGAASGLETEACELSAIKREFRRAWCAANRLRSFTHVADLRTDLVAAVCAGDPDLAEARVRTFFAKVLHEY